MTKLGFKIPPSRIQRDIMQLTQKIAASFLASLLLAGIQLNAASFYVALDGSDTNPGNEKAPFASIQRGLLELKPGDTLYLRGGLYAIESNVVVKAQGTPDAWITVAGYPGEKPVLDGSKIKGSVEDNNEYEYTIFQFDDAAHVRVKNIHVRNSWGSGFRTYPTYIKEPSLDIQKALEATTYDQHGSRHIDIIGCSSANTYGPGIGIWHSEHVKVMGCEVTGANNLDRRRSTRPAREAPHEAISIAAVSYFEVAYNHVHHGYKEGIDVKETSRHGVVHHNYIHDMKRQGLYADSWFGLLGDVEFHHNVVHDCEWGIAISAESGVGAPSKVVDIRIHHNLLYNNRASGVFFSVWGNDLWREDVAIWNNTIVNNGTVVHWAGPTGGIDIRSRKVRRLTVVNNIISHNRAFEVASVIDPVKEAQVIKDQSIVISHNLMLSGHDQTKEHKGLYPNPHLYLGNHVLMADPLFLDVDSGDFRLSPDSPAVQSGSMKWDLPGLHADLGALPYGSKSGTHFPDQVKRLNRDFRQD